MEFEWDETKRAANIAKHGLDFADAYELVDGFHIVSAASKQQIEDRCMLTGMLDDIPVNTHFHRAGQRFSDHFHAEGQL